MNKKRVFKSVQSLSGWREIAFILGLAERQLPNLMLYWSEAQKDPIVIEEQAVELIDLISMAWQACILSPNEDQVATLLDIIGQAMDALSDDESYGAQPSLDVLKLVEQALLLTVNDEKKRALECSHQSLATVTSFLELTEGEGLSEQALIKLFDSHALVEREFSFQDELAELLRSAKKPSRAQANSLRELAVDEGVSNLGISLS